MGKTARNGAAEKAFDELLVVMVQTGDRAAAERLAQRWHPRLLRSARRMAGAELAQDAVQEAWLSIMRGIGGLRDTSRFAPWALGIVHRRSIDLLRRAIRDRSSTADMPDELPAHGEDPAAGIDLARAMSSLPREQAVAAHLYYTEGLSIAEIAAVQDVPPGTAKSRLFHARRELKAALAPVNPIEPETQQ